ncbi:MAG: JAB domain-containing protein [Candidatus Amoebophilus sp.]
MKLTVNIEKLTINHALDIFEIMQLVLKREKKLNTAKEHFWVIALNNANRILNIELVSTGSTSNVIVRPMEVLSIPLQKRATGVILVHNHPSGRLEPSEEDKELTDCLIQACRLMKTPVLDHVIITENSYYSFQTSGLLERLEASNKYVLPFELEKQFHEEMEEEIKKVKEENKKKVKESLEKGLKQGEEIGIEKGLKEGVEQGRKQEVEQIARQMLKDGTPIDHIIKWTGLTNEEIQKLQQGQKIS